MRVRAPRYWQVSLEGFEAELAKQRARAQASWKGGKKEEAKGAWQDLAGHYRTLFEGFGATSLDGVKVVALLSKDGAPGTIRHVEKELAGILLGDVIRVQEVVNLARRPHKRPAMKSQF